MTDQEINIAIAEACGWKWYRRPATGPWAKKPMRCLYHPHLVPETVAELQLADMTERECNWAFIQREGLVSDYCHDLNAMHEAESSLKNAELFQEHLHDVVKRNKHVFTMADAWWYQIHATARQRAESFLRTLGKWKE